MTRRMRPVERPELWVPTLASLQVITNRHLLIRLPQPLMTPAVVLDPIVNTHVHAQMDV